MNAPAIFLALYAGDVVVAFEARCAPHAAPTDAEADRDAAALGTHGLAAKLVESPAAIRELLEMEPRCNRCVEHSTSRPWHCTDTVRVGLAAVGDVCGSRKGA